MKVSEFLKRAGIKALGNDKFRIDVSGSVYFVSDGQATIRIVPIGNDEGIFSIRYVAGQDMNYRVVVASAASKALKLPRRS